MTNYQLLIQKLDAFIRKYYANKLVRGLIIFFASLIAFYLILSVGEYYFRFNTKTRLALDFIFLGTAFFTLIAWVIIPLLKISKLGKVISHTQAAQIVGTHFTHVQDKLVNVLQLKNSISDATSQELIQASIEQKTAELTPIPFTRAIQISKNRKYLKYLLPPLLIGILLFAFAPNILSESGKRLMQPNKVFVEPPPFTFEVVNKQLATMQYSDFELLVKVNGNTVPNKMFINIGAQEFEMQAKSKTEFVYKFIKVPRNLQFNMQAAGYASKPYELKVWQKPAITNFKVHINYPDYTGQKDEVLDNMGDITAPQGTQVSWMFNTQNTDNIYFGYGQTSKVFAIAKQQNIFSHAATFMHDTTYHIIVSNANMPQGDSLHYTANIIPDQLPAIQVQQYTDSATNEFILFTGEASDDYGIKTLQLVYTKQQLNNNGQISGKAQNGTIAMPLSGKTFTQFNYMLDVENLKLAAGTKLNYYFEVWDNDAINGSKCSRSAEFTYTKPTIKQKDSLVEQQQTEVIQDLAATNKQSEKIEKQIKSLKEKMLDKPNLDWEDKQQLEQMLEQQQQMQNKVEDIKEKFKKNNEQINKDKYNENIQEKQEQLEKLMDEMLTPEMKEKLRKLEELREKLSKEEWFKKLEELKQDNDLMQKDFERMKSLLDQLEKDMRMQDLANKLKELAKKQDELKKKTNNNTKENTELKKEQDQLQKELQESKKDMDEINKLNEKQESPDDQEKMNELQEKAGDDMIKSSENLNKNDKKESSKKQQDAKEKLEELSEMLAKAAEGASEEETEIDLKATRQLLQNLIRLSFGQEALMATVKTTPTNNPQYIGNIQQQRKLQEDSKMIADSLFALSKRIAQLSSVVNKEVDGVTRNMGSAIQALEARSTGQAGVHEQYVMTGANNLALMLNELLQQLMQQQAKQKQNASGKPGSGSCKKPGGKGGGQGAGMQLKDVISKQQKLGSALEQLMARSKGQGKKPGGGKGKDGKGGEGEGEGKDGKGKGKGNGKGQGEGEGQGGAGSGGSGNGGEGENNAGESQAKEIAQIAAQQSALRKQLNDITNQLLKEGKSLAPKLLDIQKDMDRNETDLVNRRITDELQRRQSTILNRLLESKDAMREQDQGEERQSNVAKEPTRQVPASLQEILKNKQSALDYYKTVPANLKPYYKTLVEQYFGELK